MKEYQIIETKWLWRDKPRLEWANHFETEKYINELAVSGWEIVSVSHAYNGKDTWYVITMCRDKQ